MREALEHLESGEKIVGLQITNLRYARDIRVVLLAETSQNLHEMTYSVYINCSKY